MELAKRLHGKRPKLNSLGTKRFCCRISVGLLGVTVIVYYGLTKVRLDLQDRVPIACKGT